MDIGLSILIPVYNWDVNDFVNALHKQGTELNIDFEILVYNDASDQEFNTAFSNLEHVTYKRLEQNLGRSKIRNLLGKHATYSKILFLDGDSYPKHNKFLKNYWNTQVNDSTIVCGGTAYQDLRPDEKPLLRWVYGKAREEGSHGKKGFASNNFFMSKQAFLNIQFDTTIAGYGHEDTLFGITCKQKGYTFKTCDSPLYHLGLESDEQFIRKTKEGVENLRKLYNQQKIKAEDSKLIGFHESLKLVLVIKLILFVLSPVLMYLVKKHYNLKAFDLLKWYWFA